MPLSSGAYTSTRGQYFVCSRTFLLVADTVSDLIWVKCRSTITVDAPASITGYGSPASTESSSLVATTTSGRRRARVSAGRYATRARCMHREPRRGQSCTSGEAAADRRSCAGGEAMADQRRRKRGELR